MLPPLSVPNRNICPAESFIRSGSRISLGLQVFIACASVRTCIDAPAARRQLSKTAHLVRRMAQKTTANGSRRMEKGPVTEISEMETTSKTLQAVVLGAVETRTANARAANIHCVSLRESISEQFGIAIQSTQSIVRACKLAT